MESITLAIYLHFGGKIAKNLPSSLMRSEGLTTQLKVRTEGARRSVFDESVGDWVDTMPVGEKPNGLLGDPTAQSQERQTRGGGWESGSDWPRECRPEKEQDESDREIAGRRLGEWKPTNS